MSSGADRGFVSTALLLQRSSATSTQRGSTLCRTQGSEPRGVQAYFALAAYTAAFVTLLLSALVSAS